MAAARGFHIEEYQTAVQTLMERNKVGTMLYLVSATSALALHLHCIMCLLVCVRMSKLHLSRVATVHPGFSWCCVAAGATGLQAQHRELRWLRRQLIETREDYANALARIDELESFADFHRSALQDAQLAATPRQRDTWRIPKVLQARHRSPPNAQRSQRPSVSLNAASSNQPDSHSDKDHENTACDSEPDTRPLSPARSGGRGVAFAATDSARRTRDTKKLCGTPPQCSGTVDSPAFAGTPRAGSLGRSVKGLLASGVSRVLQHFEHAMSADREPDEITDQDSQDCSEPSGQARLHEEAALFVQRTDGSNDIVVQLEGSELEHDEDEGVPESGGLESSTLRSVARTVWQAAHELLADRALPPARLSTLRTIAASNPSAWEVILERHRAAKSMPLFSSIPPAAYPLIAERRNAQRDGSTNGAELTVTDSVGSLRPGGGTISHPRPPPLIGALNTRLPGRSERSHRELQASGTVTLELHSESAVSIHHTSDLGEVVVWQEEMVRTPSPARNSVPEAPTASDAERPSTELDSLRPELPAVDVDSGVEERCCSSKEQKTTPAAEPGAAAAEPEPISRTGSGSDTFNGLCSTS